MNKNYWLKPIGLPENWIGNNTFSGFREQIHFPNNAGSVQIGDWIFLYAVGHQKLVGLFQVATDISKFTDEEMNITGYEWRKEFPFYLECDNLFKLYSNHWHLIGLNPNLLDDDFSKTTAELVTPTNDSIDAIQRGKSHIRLTAAFAKFLIQKMTLNDFQI